MRERYGRPPLVGREPRSRRAAVWRFRLVALLLVVVLALVVAWLIHSAIGGEGNPGLGQGLGPVRVSIPVSPAIPRPAAR